MSNDTAPLRTIYRGCGAAALRAYLNPKGANRRRKQMGLRAMSRRQWRDEALLLIDIEAMLWPNAVMPFIEHNAQLLVELYVTAESEGAP